MTAVVETLARATALRDIYPKCRVLQSRYVKLHMDDAINLYIEAVSIGEFNGSLARFIGQGRFFIFGTLAVWDVDKVTHEA